MVPPDDRPSLAAASTVVAYSDGARAARSEPIIQAYQAIEGPASGGPVIRCVGLYRREADDATAAGHALLERFADPDQRGLRMIRAGSGKSSLAVLISETAQPQIQWAQRPDGSFAVLDGEVYNAAELTDGQPAGNAAETLLNLYMSRGIDGLALADAAAVVAIWDAGADRLLLWRDHWGLTPCFYRELPDGVLWVSRLGNLLRGEPPPRIDRHALDTFLATGFVLAPWTMAEEVRKVPSGHVLVQERSGPVRLERYLRASSTPKLQLDPAAATERLTELLTRALQRRWSPGVTTGVMVSSGVSSKLILAGMRKLLDAPVEAFTFRYTDYEGVQNEGAEARRAADYLGVRHHELTVGPRDVADNLEWLVRSYGHPFTTGLHSCILRGAVKSGMSVLMNGGGDDSWYLGKLNRYAQRYAALPSAVRSLGKLALPLARGLDPALAAKAETVMWCARTGFPSRCHQMITSERVRATLYSDPALLAEGIRAKEDLLRDAAAACGDMPVRDRMVLLRRLSITAEGNLYWNHHWTRAHGLTMRFPYYDLELNRFMMRLVRHGTRKDEVRALAATLMPEDMASTPRYPQGVPIARWLRGPLKELLLDHLSARRLKESGVFDPAGVQRLIDQFMRTGVRHEMTLWGILTILVWQDLAARGEL